MEVLNLINQVDKFIIDVNYDKCYQDLITNCNLDDYDLIIALGEARMREELTVEMQAKNVSSCSIPDNSGVLKQNEIIYSESPDILKTKLDLDVVKAVATISFDAGKFVCNNLYYHLLYNYPEKSLFIHVPNCHDNVEEYHKNARIIIEIINVLYSQNKI